MTAWATDQQIPVDKVVVEVGSALNGHRRKLLPCWATSRCTGSWSAVGPVVRVRLGICTGALAAPGRELVVVDAAGVDDDLVRDVTEILTSMWARVYGKRAAEDRAKRALAAAAATGERGAA